MPLLGILRDVRALVIPSSFKAFKAVVEAFRWELGEVRQF